MVDDISPQYDLLNDLSKLTPLGVLSAPIAVYRLPSPEPIAPDTWHWLPPGSFPASWKWLETLAFLNAVRLTYNVGHKFTVRVYCVPEDVRKLGVIYNNRGRQAFATLIDSIDTDLQSWDVLSHQRTPKPLLRRGFNMTLAQIYNDIESPKATYASTEFTRHETLAMEAIRSNQIPGLDSQLYPYQIRSVLSMFRRELRPAQMLDPRLIKVRAVYDNLYLEVDQHRFWKTPATYDTPKGFILGEEMGSGKTCECLALILITLDQVPCNPAHEPGTSLRSPESSLDQSGPRSLQELAASAIQQHSLPFLWQELSQNCYDLLDSCRPSYIIPPPARRIRPTRMVQKLQESQPLDTRPGTRIWLSHATLIVVPDTLISQWRHEINKHVQSGLLQVLVIASAKKKSAKEQMPKPAELLHYDIVLISHSRFSREEEQIGARQQCHCAYVGRTREVLCNCPEPISYVSSLTLIHWKRLIVDEGHSMSASHSKAVRFASTLHVERKVIVSGTPSRGLVGASADGQEGTQDERFDLEKLAITTIDFLGLQALDRFSWRKYVTKPFLERSPGGEAVVRQLLNSLIVRNRQSDILKDVVLPALTKRVIFLEATKETALSLNIFNALIAINAVTSQRIDQDYFFHKSQAGSLQAVVRNILVSTFFWTGTSIKDVEGALAVAKQALLVHGFTYSSTDYKLLQDSIQVLFDTLQDHQWIKSSINHELSYYLNSPLPSDICQYYTLTETYPHVLGGSAVLEAQRVVQEALAVPKPSDVNENDYLIHRLTSAGIKIRIEEDKRKTSDVTDRSFDEPITKSFTTLTSVSSPEKRAPKMTILSRANSKLVAARNRQIRDAVDAVPLAGEDPSSAPQLPATSKRNADANTTTTKRDETEQMAILSRADALSQIRIISTASAKLNYLIEEIHKHSKYEKIIVFSDFVTHTYHLAEALDTTGIPYLLYTSRLSSALKNRYILTFNTSETFRVIVMDLQLAAHGLNLSCASRVYFIQQCWSGAIESQAIKRAHRIGQTKPVTVEILALKGTIEETMQKRRMKLTGRELGDTKSITDDSVIRDAIKNPKFLECSKEQKLLASPFPLFFIDSGVRSGENGLAPLEADDELNSPSKRFKVSDSSEIPASASSDQKPGNQYLDSQSASPHARIPSSDRPRSVDDAMQIKNPETAVHLKKRRKVLRFAD